MNSNEIFDTALENKPQKVMNPKLKKTLIYILCAIIGIFIAATAIFIFREVFTGASTPQEAVAEYQTASFLYDVDGMVKYSSYYNKTVLNGNTEPASDRLLRNYLNKAYEGYSAPYDEEDLSFKLVSVIEYEKGEGRFNEFIEKYAEKAESVKDEVDTIAIIRMTIDTGKSDTTRDYVAVKCGFRWYFAWAEGV